MNDPSYRRRLQPSKKNIQHFRQDISSLFLFHPTRSGLGCSRTKSMRSITSVADPDPRSVKNILVPGSYVRELINNFLGLKYLNSLSMQCCGSGIRCLFLVFLALDSGLKIRIRDNFGFGMEKSGSGINFLDP
jgi:hypothetical protein